MDTTFYHISERTIERVAEVAASTVPGCRTLDAKLAGLAGKSFPRVNVRLDQTSGTAAIDAEIATLYPAPVAAITDAVRATIIAHVRTLTGLDVSRVNIDVANVESLGTRVTWDEVAEHEAFVIPTPIQVSPTHVVQPVTEERRELDPVVARSLVDDMRNVVVPAPPAVEHPETPAPVTPESVDVPAPVEPVAPDVPAPARLVPVTTHPTEARVPFPPEPVRPWMPQTREPQPRHPRVPAPKPLDRISIQRFARPIGVSAPSIKPLEQITVRSDQPKPITVERHQLQPITVERHPLTPIEIVPVQRSVPASRPAPPAVIVPVPPAPKPLKEIKIEPVVKYHDR